MSVNSPPAAPRAFERRREDPILSGEFGVRTASSLSVMLRSLLAVLLLLLFVSLFAFPPAENLAVAALLATIFGLFLLNRAGRLKLALYGVVASLIVYGTAAAVIYGSIRGMGTFAFVGAVVVGGLFLGRGALIAVVGASATAIGALIWAEASGRLPQPDFSVGPVHWIVHCAVLGVLAINVYFARNRTVQVLDRLRISSETYADWYWQVDSNLRFTYIHGDGLARFGISEQVALGKTSEELGGFEPLDITLENYRRLFAERRPFRDVRVRVQLGAGEDRYISINGEPVNAADGSFVGYRGITREVTGQVRAEQAMRASERRFRRIVETVPDMVFFITNVQRDRWDFVSSSVKQVWGYDGPVDAGLYAKALASRIFPQDHALLAARAPAESRGELVDVEYRISDARGGLRWMRTRTIGVPGDHGEIEVYGVTEDVTARHLALEQVHASDALQRSLLDGMAEGMIVRDLQGRITAVNQVAARIVGAPVDELVGADSFEAYRVALREDGSELSAEELPWKQVLSSDRAVLGWVQGLRRPGAETRWIRMNSVPIRSSEGLLAGVISTFQDITVERAALAELARSAAILEQRVAERTAQLEASNRELETFAHSVSHDLRAPLRTINGFARLLAEREGERLDVESRRLLSRVEAGAGRMGELIDDVIEYSSATRRAPVIGAVDLDRLCASLAGRLSQAYPETRFDIATLGTLHADARMLEIILEHLIGNALKFSSRASAPRVRIWAETGAAGKTVHVRDNGTGFDMAHASHLFTLFRRLHHDHEFPGTGVGLATVKNLVERQGGEVSAQSEPGAGATLSFRLPAGERAGA